MKTYQEFITESLPPFNYSTVLVDLRNDPDYISQITDITKDIPREEWGENGIELNPHMTVIYGLHTNNVQDVQNTLNSFPFPKEGVELKYTQFVVFEPSPSSRGDQVLVIEMESPIFYQLHQYLKEQLPNTQTFKDYKLHVTVAYLKNAKKYANRIVRIEPTLVTELTFSDKVGTYHYLQLPLGYQKY